MPWKKTKDSAAPNLHCLESLKCLIDWMFLNKIYFSSWSTLNAVLMPRDWSKLMSLRFASLSFYWNYFHLVRLTNCTKMFWGLCCLSHFIQPLWVHTHCHPYCYQTEFLYFWRNILFLCMDWILSFQEIFSWHFVFYLWTSYSLLPNNSNIFLPYSKTLASFWSNNLKKLPGSL